MSFFKSILFNTLGIEPVQFEQATQAEQRLLKILHVLIWIGFVVCYISATHYLWMIANVSMVVSLVSGIILGFIFISLIRIALLTFIPGIYNEEDGNVFTTGTSSPSVVASTGWFGKLKSFFQKGGSFLKGINFSKFVSYVFRFTFLSLIGIVISLGICCLIFKKKLDQTVANYRDKIEGNFSKYESQKRASNVAFLQKEIKNSENKIKISQNNLTQWKQAWETAPTDSLRFVAEVQWNISKREDSIQQVQLKALMEEFQTLNAREMELEQEQTAYYREKIDKENFPVVRIKEAFQMGSVKLLIIIFTLFFIVQSVFLVYLKTKSSFIYLELVNKSYREQVSDDFALLKDFVNGKEVREKYLGFQASSSYGLKSIQHLQKEIQFYPEFRDPPFNFIPIQEPKIVKKGDMFDFLNGQV